jgi:hypothetical protein
MGQTKTLLEDMPREDLLQLMTEAEWQQAVLEEEERLQQKYGNGLHARMRLTEFLNKNS